MNKKRFPKNFVGIAILTIFVMIGVVGYFVYSTQLQKVAQFQEEIPSIGVTPTELTKESIYDILAKAEAIGPVQYEAISSIITATGLSQEVIATMTAKVWQKIPYMRVEETTKDGTTKTTKMIIHPDAAYLYDAKIDKYVRMTKEAMATQFIQKSFEELSKELRENMTLKQLGSETLDGKLTIIIKYFVEIEGTPITQKLWIWKEKGIPLKSESEWKIGGITYVSKIEYKNFLFGDIPNSVFEVPKAKIINNHH